MSAQPTPRAKICVRCGCDCSNVPRRKNPAGEYCCKECIDNPRRAMKTAAPEPEYNPFPLATPPHVSAGMRECAACMRLIAADARVCVYCGFNPDAPPLAAVEGAKCRHCGYDLTGLKSPRCPECGKLLTPRRRFAVDREATSREVARWEYLRPLLMIVICLPLHLAVNWLFDGRDEALEALFGVAVQVPVATLVFLGCCMLWIGFDAPIHLTVLRLAGILSAVALTSQVAGFIPIWFLSAAITIFVYVGLLAEMLDMDFSDAAIVAILSYFAGIGVWLWVLFAMQ